MLVSFLIIHETGYSYTSGTECHTVPIGLRVKLQETVSAGT